MSNVINLCKTHTDQNEERYLDLFKTHIDSFQSKIQYCIVFPFFFLLKKNTSPIASNDMIPQCNNDRKVTKRYDEDLRETCSVCGIVHLKDRLGLDFWDYKVDDFHIVHVYLVHDFYMVHVARTQLVDEVCDFGKVIYLGHTVLCNQQPYFLLYLPSILFLLIFN